MRNFWTAITGVGGLCASFFHESIKAWFFDKVVHQMNAYESFAVEYGPALAFACMCAWLLWFRPHPKKENAMSESRKPSSDAPVVSGNNNSVSVNQSGNAQTAHTIINQAPPPPEINLIREVSILKRSEGVFDWHFTFEIVSTTPLGTLVIAAKSPEPTVADVLNVAVNPLTAGTVQYGSWASGGAHFIRLQNPFGKYQVTVTTSDAKPQPKLELFINQ